jgi:hypothetical protein
MEVLKNLRGALQGLVDESGISALYPEKPRSNQTRVYVAHGAKKTLELGGAGVSELWLETQELDKEKKEVCFFSPLFSLITFRKQVACVKISVLYNL